jgi:hypothetical protein
VAFHQALFIASGFAFHHSFITYNFLREHWHWPDQFFFTTLVYFTLADLAMPISPTYVAAGYPPM